MKQLLCFSLTITVITSLICSIYDFSQPKVRCTETCPPSTTLVGNNCLTSNQYLNNSQIFTCLGYVSNDRTVCCPRNNFIQNNKCLLCRGQVFNNGQSCCSNDKYLDFSQEVPNCVPLSTGNCPTLNLSSSFKICCAQPKMYFLPTGQCIDRTGFNCDNTLRICCGTTQRLEYIDGRYECVNQCNWTPYQSIGIFCQRMECNTANQTMPSIKTSKSGNSLLSFNSNCCYGLDSSSQCIKDINSCLSTFANKGWSICCPVGNFYSPANKNCVEDCEGGVVLFDSVCISRSKALDLRGSNPLQIDSFSNCNGMSISPNFPVCCPSGFFIADNTGCRLCNGNIFTLIGYQVCCSNQQYFDSKTRTCRSCQGNLDVSGQLCCPFGSYIYYDNSGSPSCSDNCDLENLYNAQSCCQSLTQSCNIALLPNSCNLAYYNPKACRGCPNFCSTNQVCTISQQSPCNAACGQNQVFYQSIGCLSCDKACSGCSQPLDASSCLNCATGFVMIQSKCNVCAAMCLTCFQFTDYCTSCQPNTKILHKNKCITPCFNQSYYLDTTTMTCQACSSSCVQCSNIKNNCTMCQDTTYLNQGTCSLCNYSCASCIASPKMCTKCITGYFKNRDSTCSQECIGIAVYQYVNGPICIPCHPSCIGCTLFPQNCFSCISNSTYIDGQLGINVCTPCKSPCVTCISLEGCLSCIDGFYLVGSRCSKCDASCLTCNGPSKSNCLSCFGSSKITSNGFCSGCSSSCNVCNGTTCTVCLPGFLLYQGNCVSTCPIQTYKNRDNCVKCDDSCTECNSTNCNICASGFSYILNNLCYKSCPLNYTPNGKYCIKNIVPPQNKNNTNNNTNNENSTNNSTKNQTKPTNNTPSTIVTGNSINQAIVITGSKMFVNIYLPQTTLTDVNVSVKLVNSKTGSAIELKPQGNIDKTNNKVYFSASLPNYDLTDFSLVETKAVGTNINLTQLSSQTSNQIVMSTFVDDKLSNMKVFGYIFSPIIIFFIVLTKIKGHFSAEEANNLILHTFNFGQVCYLFKFATTLESGGYFFLNGFGVTHLNFFPNFFSSMISPYYVQNTVEKTLIPDGNLLRNAGYTFSYQIIAALLLGVGAITSIVYSKVKELDEFVHFRKIMRLGILLLHVGFMNQLFFSFVQIIQPSTCQPEFQSFYNSNVGFSYMLIFLVPILMVVVLYHYYKTYNSDVLEHYYTLRQGSLFLMIYSQAIIMCLSVGKPLVGLFLIPLEIMWFIFNYFLYRYGSGISLSNYKKYFVVSSVISVSYICLSLEGVLNWLAVVVMISFSAIVLIVYCGYQLVGIYYLRFFDEAKTQD